MNNLGVFCRGEVTERIGECRFRPGPGSGRETAESTPGMAGTYLLRETEINTEQTQGGALSAAITYFLIVSIFRSVGLRNSLAVSAVTNESMDKKFTGSDSNPGHVTFGEGIDIEEADQECCNGSIFFLPAERAPLIQGGVVIACRLHQAGGSKSRICPPTIGRGVLIQLGQREVPVEDLLKSQAMDFLRRRSGKYILSPISRISSSWVMILESTNQASEAFRSLSFIVKFAECSSYTLNGSETFESAAHMKLLHLPLSSPLNSHP